MDLKKQKQESGELIVYFSLFKVLIQTTLRQEVRQGGVFLKADFANTITFTLLSSCLC